MSTAQLCTYDFDQVSCLVGPIICDGFGEGEGIVVESASPIFTKYVGSDGKVTRTKTLDKSGKITITLAQSSATNDKLSALALLDQNAPNGAGVGPLFIRDKSGRGVWTAAQCWIAEFPQVDLKNAVTTRAWVIECAVLERVDGGN